MKDICNYPPIIKWDSLEAGGLEVWLSDASAKDTANLSGDSKNAFQ